MSQSTAPSTTHSPVGAALETILQRALGSPPEDERLHPLLPRGSSGALRTVLLATQERSRAALPQGTAGRTVEYVPPAPGFEPEPEGWFVDLHRVTDGPWLVVAHQAQPDGRLRRALSHSGFLAPLSADEGPPWVRPASPVLGDTPLVSALGGHALLPLAPTGARIERTSAKLALDALEALGGHEVEVVRLYRHPARLRSARDWAARSERRSEAEEAPYLRVVDGLVAALLDELGPGHRLRVHDPACHDGHVPAWLARDARPLELSCGDVDERWVERCVERLRGLETAVEACPASPAWEQAGVSSGSLDLALLRAANRGVMTAGQAAASLRRTAETLRPGGVAVVYGYSFPLVCAAHAKVCGLEPLCCSLRMSPSPLHTRGRVPFYLLVRTASAIGAPRQGPSGRSAAFPG